MPAKSQFGQIFRKRRTALGLNLSEFCRRNGFDKGNVSRLERDLTPPPDSQELLETYADALQLVPDSEDRAAFMREAAQGRGKLAPPRRLHVSWVEARNLEQWSSTRDAQGTLPTLVRQLVYASTEQPTRIEIPGGDGVQRHGWDGVVEASKPSLFVPEGVSAWEISDEQNPASKAERVYKARNTGPLGVLPSETTFVFVTSRKWDGKQKWRDAKRTSGKWRSVEAYDSSDLELWLETAPGVDAWIAEQLGLRPAGVESISDYWASLSRICEPPLKPEVFLASREKTAEKLRAFLLGTPGVMPFECRSPIEALDFVAASLALEKSGETGFTMDEDERIRTLSRTVIVKDRAQWDGLSQTTGPLNLLPIPALTLSGEELNAAIRRGHRVVIAATQYANHRLQAVALPRPSRYDLEKVLRDSGYNREHAEKAARAAGGSLSVLKRQLSAIPIVELPSWCTDAGLSDFMPLLLVGAWDEANEVDRNVLSRLLDRPYGEVQNIANRMLLVADAPLSRIETRWRVVSPEDSWALVGSRITDSFLNSFESIAIEILGQQDDSLTLSADERFKASLKGELKPLASGLLRHGISETAAILGSGFESAAKLPGSRERAIRIVRSTLQNAPWLRWATLGRVLPLLAEAAPDAFLAAINADLNQSQPELTKVLADDKSDHPLMSHCKHAGLLWALEGLAWSPDLLPKVCTTLAKLAEVDSGTMWGNRPIGSLCNILLPWHPQTVAGVDKRIAVLNSLAERTPSVAWKVSFTMLPQPLAHSDLTHRPVWRKWVSDWKEGTTGADYWKQVNAAAELLVRLVGDSPARWRKVLDELGSVPEPYRSQLIEKLKRLSVAELHSEDRRSLVEHLRKTIQHNRDFANADWALPADSLEELDEALTTLIPNALTERHAWLFVPWIDLEGFQDDYDAMEAEINRLRATALREIIDDDGFDGILKLAEIVESPGWVGATLARIGYSDEQILPRLLDSSNGNYQSLAAAYAAERTSTEGWEWARSLSLEKWSVAAAASLLAQIGLDPEGWSLAESLGDDVLREYWKTVPARRGRLRNKERLEFACQELLKAGRPDDAIDVLSLVVFDNVDVSPTIVMDALVAWQERSSADAAIRDDTLRTIQRLFGRLQETIPFSNDEHAKRLAELESRYLDLLDGFGAMPQTLFWHLSENPAFFARLITAIYRSQEEQESNTNSTEAEKKRASHGFRLLMNWNRVPGAKPDGTVDEERLLAWLEAARSLCRDSGHLEVADAQIGEMLASWPKPEDEGALWPCTEICDAIEEANSDDLDRGFQIGVFNSRGVTTRSPLDGGDLERKEAAKYRRWAELCEIDWPRTAASLRNVAESYLIDAQREDARAEERAQDRH